MAVEKVRRWSSGAKKDGAVPDKLEKTESGSSSKPSKDAYVPNPIVEIPLTAVFIGLVCWLPWVYPKEPKWFLSIFAVAFVCVEAVVMFSRWTFRALGRFISQSAVHWDLVDSDPLASRYVREKFMAQSWQFVVHVVLSFWEFYLLFVRKPDELLPAVWSKPHTAFENMANQEQAPELWGLYVFHLSLWVYLGILHVFFEPRRKDFLPMLIHHIATIILITGSIRTNGMRAGLMVLFVNDFPDIFVDLLKMTNYLKLRGGRALYIAETAFVMMMLFFAIFRLWIMPFKVNYDCLVVLYNTLRDPVTEPTQWYEPPFSLKAYPVWLPLNSMLWVLTALNVWWFWLMVRIIIKIVNDGAGKASREEYEGDSDGEEDEPIDGYVIQGVIRILWRAVCGEGDAGKKPKQA